MKEKQEIRRIEIGIIQLVVVVFAAMVASKIPYIEITQGSIVLLGVVHVVSYYISSYYENLKYRGYLDELIATVKYCFIFALIATFLSFFADGSFSISRRGFLYVTLISVFSYTLQIQFLSISAHLFIHVVKVTRIFS